jgi:hypothetical protein
VPDMSRRFGDFEPDGRNWITLASGEFYPDVLPKACELYAPVIKRFGDLLRRSGSSQRLLVTIARDPMSTQLMRVFRRYVTPQLPVEMLKKKRIAVATAKDFGSDFRPIEEVQAKFDSRPVPDEPLCALLWEYKDRGKKGYSLTDQFFELFSIHHPDFSIEGPRRAGRDIPLGSILRDYPQPDTPVDFIIRSRGGDPVVVGFARYDGDRGGAQEDDRTGHYRDVVQEVLGYSRRIGRPIRVLLINDGPGLLLGTMWRDYASLEELDDGVRVMTLRMVPYRLTDDWMLGR